MKYIIANWKMNLGLRESVALARGTLQILQGKERVPEIVIAPSFTALAEVRKTLARTRISLGAQNVGPARSGALTGEVGVAQLEDIGCQYVIVGHSERRLKLGEPDEVVAEKLKVLFENSSMTPILCVGEPLDARNAGKADEYVVGQIERALKGVSFSRRRKLIVAYEPVWAIGSGKSATPVDAMKMAEFIRRAVTDVTGAAGEQVVVLYGGSVDSANAYGFLREPSIDGLLVGGASLKIYDIHSIIQAACDVITAQDAV